jgi:hypothetical protein
METLREIRAPIGDKNVAVKALHNLGFSLRIRSENFSGISNLLIFMNTSLWILIYYTFTSNHLVTRKITIILNEYVTCIQVKVKQSHYRPWQTLRVPRYSGSQISRQSAHEGGKVVSPMHPLPLPQEISLVLIFVRGWVDPSAILRPEGLCQSKIPMTPSGIDPATFRFVAQCLNHWHAFRYT